MQTNKKVKRKFSDEINVFLISEYYYPVISGAGERFRRYAPGLLERGIHLHIFTVIKNDALICDSVDGIQVIRFPVAKLSNRLEGSGSVSDLLIRKTYEYCRKTNIWPDAFHFLNHTYTSSFDIGIFRLHGYPCISSVTMMPGLPRSKIGLIKLHIRQWIRYIPFNQIITLSEVMSARMKTFGISTSRIKSIPNGVELSRFRPPSSVDEKRIIRDKLEIKPETEVILFVGHIIPRKGVDLLVKAWKQVSSKIPNATLLLFGAYTKSDKSSNDRDQYLLQINKIIAESGSSERVFIIEEVDNIDQYMRAADIFVFPSRMEGNPNVVMEAMASGLPCLITPFEGLSHEIGVAGRDYLLAQFSEEQLANAIIRMIEDRSEKVRIGKAARKYAEENFCLNATLDQYADMYKALIIQRKKAPTFNGH